MSTALLVAMRAAMSTGRQRCSLLTMNALARHEIARQHWWSDIIIDAAISLYVFFLCNQRGLNFERTTWEFERSFRLFAGSMLKGKESVLTRAASVCFGFGSRSAEMLWKQVEAAMRASFRGDGRDFDGIFVPFRAANGNPCHWSGK
jgi:hypothetical protein